jgi:hypothetical protein
MATERHPASVDESAAWDALVMFERFNQPARQVVVLAQESARDLGHNYIGTEHELLGLVREREAIASRVLIALGLTEARIRDDIIRIVGYTPSERSSGQIPFTPRAKTVLEDANRERDRLGDPEVGTQHILLGLLDGEGHGIALRVLAEAGFETPTIRNELVRVCRQRPMQHATDADRSVLPAEWLTSISAVLAPLGSEIRKTHGREPDTGDLLIVLGRYPGLPVARALEALLSAAQLRHADAAHHRHRGVGYERRSNPGTAPRTEGERLAMKRRGIGTARGCVAR